MILLGIGFAASLLAGNWSTLENDGLHDPSNPSLRLLQDPAQALSVLASDTAGNKVDWVAAVRQGQIRPRTSVDNSRVPAQHDSVIIMSNTLSLPAVRFPHAAHNLWMSCEMCHDFPLTECNRCHSVVGDGQLPAIKSGAVMEAP